MCGQRARSRLKGCDERGTTICGVRGYRLSLARKLRYGPHTAWRPFSRFRKLVCIYRSGTEYVCADVRITYGVLRNPYKQTHNVNTQGLACGSKFDPTPECT